MLYLDKKQFTPQFIFFSVLFLPAITALAIGCCISFGIEVLIVLGSLTLTYLTIVFYLWKNASKELFYIALSESYATIFYDDNIQGGTKLNLRFDQLHTIKYYRITTIKGWLMSLLSYRCPKSIYLEYWDGSDLIGCFIGYLDYADVEKIANITNVKLKIY